MESMDSLLLRLPSEVLSMIAEECADPRDVVSLMKTCRAAKVAVDSPLMWMRFFERKFDLNLSPAGDGGETTRLARYLHGPSSVRGIEGTHELCKTLSRHLGCLYRMSLPRPNLHAGRIGRRNDRIGRGFGWALGILVDYALADGEASSNNLALLEVLVRNPANHNRLFGVNVVTRRSLTSIAQGPHIYQMAPFFLMFLHLAFQPEIAPRWATDCSNLHEFQCASYTTKTQLFSVSDADDVLRRVQVEDVGLTKLLNMIQLFRYHLLFESDILTIRDEYLGLEHRPSAWKTCILSHKAEVYQLLPHWKGLTISMRPRGLRYLATINAARHPENYLDHDYLNRCVENVGDATSADGFESLHLEYPQEMRWPEEFEDLLPVFPPDAKGPMQADAYINTPTRYSMPVVGRMRANDVLYLITGNLSHVFRVQMGECGSMGFQRLAFVAVPLNMNFSGITGPQVSLADQIGSVSVYTDECYTYEGLVMPGGTMVVGQWRQTFNHLTRWNAVDPTDSIACGPFMFWNISLSGKMARKGRYVDSIIRGTHGIEEAEIEDTDNSDGEIEASPAAAG